MNSKIPICWEKEKVGKAISLKAKIDEKQTHYFLACHSPMTHIQDEKSKRKISEEELFNNLITSSQRDKQVVIYGEPGTGKSHLVHWLKLRYAYGVENKELQNVVPVLIERRSGSLKDALSQLIEQLGGGFKKYLDPVQQALEKLSNSTARQMLANELSLELGPRWTDRGREKINKLLKHLGQACRAEGFGGWLCRDNGVIDRTINLLTEASDIRDREQSPEFAPGDLLVKDKFRRGAKNSQDVLALIDDLDDDEKLRKLAADHMNEAMKSAIVDMVGLSGANLRKVFDSIREDLAVQGKQLALFIEDVSAMSELDVEIVNALEPQDRTDLCPLTAVLGMTHTGYAKLRDNQKQRIEFVFRVDGETTDSWSKDSERLAQFTARYLNAIRLDEDQVKKIAHSRQETNADVQISKCTDCPAKALCHETFGHVDVAGTEIGLYPFSRETAPRVLKLIRNDKATPYSANQRGLLIRLLSPVLSDTASIEKNNFPNPTTLPVHLTTPYYWAEFLQGYLGEYSETDRNRIQTLAGLWIEETDDSDQAAGLLQPFVDPLGFSSFTKETKKPTKATKTNTQQTGGEKPADDKAKEAVKKLLESLSNWLRGEKLVREDYFRDRLSDLIRNGINWRDYLQPAQFDDWTWGVVKGRKFILIEGQSASAERLRFEFPRSEQTRALLEALCRYDKEGGKSWSFDFAEPHRRTVATWLRKNEHAVVSKLDPDVSREVAIDSSVQFLSLYAIVRERESLPQKSIPDLMARLLQESWKSKPVALSKDWQQLIDNLNDRHMQVLDFVKNEISVRQGRGEINFVSPSFVAATCSKFQKNPEVADLSDDYFTSFWKSRFAGLPNESLVEKKRFSNLTPAISDERQQIKQAVEAIVVDLKTLGFEGKDIKSDLMMLCDQVVELQEVAKKNFPIPDPEFDQLVKAKVFTQEKMRLAFESAKAEKIAESKDPFDVLTFEPSGLIQCSEVVSAVVKRVEKLSDNVAEQEEEIKKDGDPQEFVKQMFESLGNIANLDVDILEARNVKTS